MSNKVQKDFLLGMTIDFKNLLGLEPKSTLCLDKGIPREEVKDFLFDQGLALSDQSLQSLQSVALHILGLNDKNTVTQDLAQDICEEIFRSRQTRNQFKELNRLRRRGGFYKKLVKSLESARLCFLDLNEASLYHQILDERKGSRQIRQECLAFSSVYEKHLLQLGLWDYPLLLIGASHVLESQEVELSLASEIVWVSERQILEPREEYLLSKLQSLTTVQRICCKQLKSSAPDVDTAKIIQLEKWHSIDDAAEGALDWLVDETGNDYKKLNNWVVLIPDQPWIRKSIVRALSDRGIPLLDDRDPTQLRSQNWVKSDLLSIKMVSKNYQAKDVISWIRKYHKSRSSEWEKSIYTFGVTSGIESYKYISELYGELKKINYKSRMSFSELKDCHLNELKNTDHFEFWETQWEKWIEDRQKANLPTRKEPLLALELLISKKLEALSPHMAREKSEFGVRLHRLGQPFFSACSHVLFFALPPDFSDQDVMGDMWFNSFERESLSTEFSFRNREITNQERDLVIKNWILDSTHSKIVTYCVDQEGREQSTYEPMIDKMREHGCEIEVVEKGAHSRYLTSYLPKRLKLSGEADFGRRQGESSITASELDQYSRCSFKGLSSRWKLKDLRIPSREPWPDSLGRILHLTIKLILENKTRSTNEAILLALRSESLRGMYQSKWLKVLVLRKITIVIEKFFEKDKEYQERCKAQAIHIEGPALKMIFKNQITVKGIPDRVDRVDVDGQKGLFILDYKLGSNLPKGIEMLEKAYRLQVPFYALALKKIESDEVIGLQFVELNKKGTRSSGLFFKSWNGKMHPSNVRSNNTSLLDLKPDEAWTILSEKLESVLDLWHRQVFIAKPVKGQQECLSCDLGLFCGQKRRTSDLLASDGQ